MLSVHKIIVHSYGMWFEPVDTQLYRQPVGKRRLARGRRTCDQDKPCIALFGYLLCDFSDLTFLMCLLHKHNFTHVILCDHIIERPYSLDILTVSPLYGLFQHVEKFRTGDKFRHLLRHFRDGI